MPLLLLIKVHFAMRHFSILATVRVNILDHLFLTELTTYLRTQSKTHYFVMKVNFRVLLENLVFQAPTSPQEHIYIRTPS